MSAKTIRMGVRMCKEVEKLEGTNVPVMFALVACWLFRQITFAVPQNKHQAKQSIMVV